MQVEIERAYDPEKAKMQTGCWFNELLNGQTHDLQGYQEFECMQGVDSSNMLSAHKQHQGPSVEHCGADMAGVVRKCDGEKPWLREPSSDRCERHHQLEDVMGMNLKKLAKPQPSIGLTCDPERRCNKQGAALGTLSLLVVLIIVVALLGVGGFLLYKYA